jgi:CBS domain-containing protein
MKASDIMVSTVITVGPDASVQDVADLLVRNRTSAPCPWSVTTVSFSGS